MERKIYQQRNAEIQRKTEVFFLLTWDQAFCLVSVLLQFAAGSILSQFKVIIYLVNHKTHSQNACFFNDFFKCINKVHQYQTRLANKISYYLPKARTNYGKFNIRFFGVKVWNSIEDSLKSESRTCFKNLLKDLLISNY